jgi:hypothetical protein
LWIDASAIDDDSIGSLQSICSPECLWLLDSDQKAAQSLAAKAPPASAAQVRRFVAPFGRAVCLLAN